MRQSPRHTAPSHGVARSSDLAIWLSCQSARHTAPSGEELQRNQGLWNRARRTTNEEKIGIHTSGAWDTVGYSTYDFGDTLYLHRCLGHDEDSAVHSGLTQRPHRRAARNARAPRPPPTTARHGPAPRAHAPHRHTATARAPSRDASTSDCPHAHRTPRPPLPCPPTHQRLRHHSLVCSRPIRGPSVKGGQW